MSRLYWHSSPRTVELRGSEGAWLRHLANGPAQQAWDFARGVGDPLERAATLLDLVPTTKRSYMHDMLDEARLSHKRDDFTSLQFFYSCLHTALKVDGFPLELDGVALHTNDLARNTALVTGSDPVRLAAKISGWGELHCWVDEPNRHWLAAIIEEGLDKALYRRGLWHEPMPGGPMKWSRQGWEDVLALLRDTDVDGPVVLSHSVTGWFPNSRIADWDAPVPPDWRPQGWGAGEWAALPADEQGEHRDDDADGLFWQLSQDEQWERAMAGLRQRRPWARLAPDTLANTFFGRPVTIYDLFAPDRDERIARAAAAPRAA